MTVRNAVEKMANDVGFDIGCSCDEAQANLLNGFFEGLWTIREHSPREMQIAYIDRALSRETKQRLVEFAEFVRLGMQRTS